MNRLKNCLAAKKKKNNLIGIHEVVYQKNSRDPKKVFVRNYLREHEQDEMLPFYVYLGFERQK